ncbi:MAG: putative metal-dependent hydrolase [Saprospiraceae bacterium]|nr:putative metal-dependent hydrolase [Saprospiraceae bacterium]
MSQEKLKYPIGRFRQPVPITAEFRQQAINELAAFPKRLRNAVHGLSDEQLDTPYRPEGWTIRQVVHHCSDSHMNALIRIKLALTEDQPVIKPYMEALWALLPDSAVMPVDAAIVLIEGLHARWTFLLERLTTQDLERTYIHPDHGDPVTVDEAICQYAWHANHHLAHITSLIQREGW